MEVHSRCSFWNLVLLAKAITAVGNEVFIKAFENELEILLSLICILRCITQNVTYSNI